MHTLDIIILSVILLIILSLIDRFWFRKIIVSNITKVDPERNLIQSKVYLFFGLIKNNTEFIQYQGKYYMKFSDNEVSTNQTDPRFIDKGVLKYNLEK